ncbi:MAG: hypothetical protein QXU99_04675 [Candidatus Bathyarchaeia archaeon]
MKVQCDVEEIRWQVVKAMLDDFPELRDRIRNYMKKPETKHPK